MNTFKKLDRVHAGGDRYGSVVHVETRGRKLVHVLMDNSNRVVKFSPDNLTPADLHTWLPDYLRPGVDPATGI